jgi:hypothetical protein
MRRFSLVTVGVGVVVVLSVTAVVVAALVWPVQHDKALEAAWIQAGATAAVGFLAALLALEAARISVGLREQVQLGIATRRFSSCSRLWAVLGDLRAGRGPMTAQERNDIADKLTAWYYEPEGGLLLTPATFRMWQQLRDSLRSAPGLKPDTWAQLARAHPADVDRLILRQASLLRTQLKLDCQVYQRGTVSEEPLMDPFDTDFVGLPRADGWPRPQAVDENAYLDAVRRWHPHAGRAAA